VERLLFKLTLNEGEDEYQGTQPKVGDKRLKVAELGEGAWAFAKFGRFMDLSTTQNLWHCKCGIHSNT
jgi:hypothetical protein